MVDIFIPDGDGPGAVQLGVPNNVHAWTGTHPKLTRSFAAEAALHVWAIAGPGASLEGPAIVEPYRWKYESDRRPSGLPILARARCRWHHAALHRFRPPVASTNNEYEAAVWRGRRLAAILCRTGPYYCQAERVTGVAGPQPDRTRPRSQPYPLPYISGRLFGFQPSLPLHSPLNTSTAGPVI